jgi:hypothetical protein
LPAKLAAADAYTRNLSTCLGAEVSGAKKMGMGMGMEM